MAEAETIGQRIKRERVKLGLTQRELAAKVVVGVPHISKVEGDRENPSDDLLDRLARVFGVPTDELLLVARRMPPQMIEDLAADPAQALEFLRTFRQGPKRPGRK
jgi:transcriptional regulator with XRE-family HTH domain